jgi:hypothetical protein
LATWPQFDEPQGDTKPLEPEANSLPVTEGPLSPDELLLLRAFFQLLDEWDRKKNLT